MSNTSQLHKLWHARLPYPSLSPRVCLNSCPLSQWSHPTISSSVTLSSFCSQAFPASRSFSISWLFASGGQSIGASASVNMQGWFPLGLTRLISLQSKGLKSLLQHHNLKAQFLQRSAFLMVQLSYPHVTTGKTIALTIQTFVGKVMFLFLTHCLSLPELSFQGASIFYFHGCRHHPQEAGKVVWYSHLL